MALNFGKWAISKIFVGKHTNVPTRSVNLANKILIIRNDHIGDLVYATPIFRELKRAMPDCEITVIASPLNRAIIDKNPYIDKIIELEIPAYSFKSIWKYFKMSFKLRKEKFDYGLDLRGSTMNSLFLLKLAGIKNKISHIEWHPSMKHLLDKSLCFDKKRHIFEDNAEFLNEFGIKPEDEWPEIITDEEDRKKVDEFIKKNYLKKFICICPVAGLPEKQWELDRFKSLIEHIWVKHPEYEVVLFGREKDKEKIMKLPFNVAVYDANVRLLPLIFKKSALVIAHDGGPMHSAWLTESNVLALYPKSVADKFFPLYNCTTFTSTSTLNMDSITLDEVKKAVDKIL